MMYDDICRKKGCDHYIEWDYSLDSETQPYPCVSCNLVGQSHHIDIIPDACPFMDAIRAVTTVNALNK